MSSGYRHVESYHRRAQLEFFKTFDDPFYCVTFELEAAPVRRFASENGYSTFFNLCYLMTRAMRQVEDFRYRIVDGELVLFDELHFSATLPAAEGPYRFARFPYLDDIHEANRVAAEAMTNGGGASGLEDPEEPNFIFYSALPKVHFTGLTHVRPNDRFEGQPRVSFGKFGDGEELRVPVGIMVNHIFIDGGALGELAEVARETYIAPR